MVDQFDSDETIVALATAREPGYPRGIIRISGGETRRILAKSFTPAGSTQLADCRLPTRLSGSFVCEQLASPIPVQVLFWPNNRSYTGQVSAEIHAPGAIPILDAIVEQVCANGARLAGAGEFTLRAFLGGRIDLTEAEAVLGVIDANDQNHLNVALKQLAGGLSRPIHQSRDGLLHSLAQLEAGLDFVEEDIEFITAEQLLEEFSKCEADLRKLENQLANRDQQETVLRLVLYGQPNAGKSSLFNALAKRFGKTRREAIVSSESGTTRDFISNTLTIAGREMILVDTAGVDLQESKRDQHPTTGPSPLELGQEQSLIQQRESKLTLFCIDASQSHAIEKSELPSDDDQRTIVCLTKSDLPSSLLTTADEKRLVDKAVAIARVSSVTGQGIDALAKTIVEISENAEPVESVLSTAVRCKLAVANALESLETAKELVRQSSGDELVACEIRSALDAIGTITGAVYTDDILDVIFGQFCIGK